MIALVILTFVDLFATLFKFLLLVRVIASFFASPANPFYAWLVTVTEPVLAPIRRLLPAAPGWDFAPLVAFFLLEGLQIVARMVFAG